jgi:hypothetical protein
MECKAGAKIKVEHGGLSQFVLRSMARELVRLAREEHIEQIVRQSGPLDPREADSIRPPPSLMLIILDTGAFIASEKNAIPARTTALDVGGA